MIEKPSLPTAEEIAALPELEFLELDRDCDHINAEYDFKRAGIHALGAGAYGTLAASAMMSAAPYGALMGTLIAIPAAVYVWDAIQDIGKGVQDTTKSAAADTTLRVLYQHEGKQPSMVVHDAEPAGRVIDGRAASLSQFRPL
jgi:hypothetical protein